VLEPSIEVVDDEGGLSFIVVPPQIPTIGFVEDEDVFGLGGVVGVSCFTNSGIPVEDLDEQLSISHPLIFSSEVEELCDPLGVLADEVRSIGKDLVPRNGSSCNSLSIFKQVISLSLSAAFLEHLITYSFSQAGVGLRTVSHAACS